MSRYRTIVTAGLALALAAGLGAVASCGGQQAATSTGPAPTPEPEPEAPAPVADGTLDRTALPIAEPTSAPITELDARNATAPPRFEVKAPEGAPNVVVVLIDDIGFGATETFGGTIRTPVLERLAEGGLRYNQFHTTALCSPTRMALLTGRNHHSANTGSVQEVATAFPGNQGIRPQSVAPLAEMLQLNGYGTAAFGKYHETPPWEISVAGPFARWPTNSGFDKFYGFIGGETNQWAPFLHDGVTPVEPPDDPDYHLTTDLADQAISWARARKSLRPDEPFFMYFAPGATHAPHHAPPEWIEPYRGQFDDGWDAYRTATLARQIELGVVPEGTELTPMPDEAPAWESLSDDEKRLFARQMEVFAGFTTHTDHQIGRVVDALEEMGELDDTLIFVIFGDNGSSAEGGPTGTFNEMFVLNGQTDTAEQQLEHIDELGGPMSYGHFSAFWALATDTPFQWTKQVASHYGGTRNPLVVHWPNGIEASGEVRAQWHHVIDIAPTVMEAAGLPFPVTVNGVTQKPFEGPSMIYSFNEGDAADRHTTQYFEMFGNRAIYHEGWVAAAKHRTPWHPAPDGPLEDDVWQLYHVAEDFSQAHDVAAENPDKLAELQALFMSEAERYNVLPIDDRTFERFNAAIAGRPDLMGDRTTMTLHEGMPSLMENTFLNVKNRSHTITAELELPARGEGVILCQGGRFAGWSLYMLGGRLHYTYNYFNRERFTVSSRARLPAGATTVRYEFTYDGGEPGSGGVGALYVGDDKVGEARIERTVPAVFSADETTDVGRDGATPVVEAYADRDEFNGTIGSVTIALQ